MFEFITSMDSGINPAAEGVAAPSVDSAFIASLPPIAGPISEETIARFQAAMEKPLADNAMLQQALETMIKSDKPVVSDRAQNKVINEAPIIPTTEDAKITESPVIEKPIVVSVKPTVVVENPQVVVTETPKVFERTVTFGAEEIPEVAVKTEISSTESTKITETIKPVVAETPKASESSVTLVAKEKPVLTTEAPILTVENSKITESPVIEKPTVVVEKSQVVVTETPKTLENSMTFVAEDIPEVAVKNEAPIIAATEDTKIAETIKPAVAIPVVIDEDERSPEEVTIAALPQGVAPEAIARPIEVKTPEVAPVVAASVEAKVEAVTAAEVLVEAANAVADTMLVSPGLMRGEGEIIVQLKQDVLSGTELKIAVQSGTMTVEFTPTVEKIATLLEQNQGSLVQVLSERVGRYNIVMNVRPIHEKGSRHART